VEWVIAIWGLVRCVSPDGNGIGNANRTVETLTELMKGRVSKRPAGRPRRLSVILNTTIGELKLGFGPPTTALKDIEIIIEYNSSTTTNPDVLVNIRRTGISLRASLIREEEVVIVDFKGSHPKWGAISTMAVEPGRIKKSVMTYYNTASIITIGHIPTVKGNILDISIGKSSCVSRSHCWCCCPGSIDTWLLSGKKRTSPCTVKVNIGEDCTTWRYNGTKISVIKINSVVVKDHRLPSRPRAIYHNRVGSLHIVGDGKGHILESDRASGYLGYMERLTG
jgi:hypothetical protein